MKRLFLIMVFILLAASLWAADVKLAWDPMPAGQTWTEVRIYEKNASSGATLVGTAPMPATSITIPNVPKGTHTYIARSWNGQEESLDSNEVTGVILERPLAPTSITITIVVK